MMMMMMVIVMMVMMMVVVIAIMTVMVMIISMKLCSVNFQKSMVLYKFIASVMDNLEYKRGRSRQ